MGSATHLRSQHLRQRQVDLWVQIQPGLQNEFQDSQGYTEKFCLKKGGKRKKGRKERRKDERKKENLEIK